MLAKANPPKITSVAIVPAAGDSPAMNANVEAALVEHGLQVKAPLPGGTRRSQEVDATVSYVDVWRWDVSMYLKSISIRLFDAKTGDLLATGQWNDSDLHGFRDAKETVSELIGEMLAKLRAGANWSNQVRPPPETSKQHLRSIPRRIVNSDRAVARRRFYTLPCGSQRGEENDEEPEDRPCPYDGGPGLRRLRHRTAAPAGNSRRPSDRTRTRRS